MHWHYQQQEDNGSTIFKYLHYHHRCLWQRQQDQLQLQQEARASKDESLIQYVPMIYYVGDCVCWKASHTLDATARSPFTSNTTLHSPHAPWLACLAACCVRSRPCIGRKRNTHDAVRSVTDFLRNWKRQNVVYLLRLVNTKEYRKKEARSIIFNR